MEACLVAGSRHPQPFNAMPTQTEAPLTANEAPNEPSIESLLDKPKLLEEYQGELLEKALEVFRADGGQVLERLTPEQVQSLKKLHNLKTISELLVWVDEKTVACAYLRPPRLSTVTRVHAFEENDFENILQVAFEECWLCGYEPIKTQDDLLIQCIVPIVAHLSFRSAALKKS